MESQKIVYSHYVLPKEVVIFENGDDIPEDVIVIKQFPIEIFSFHEDIGQVKLDIQAVIEKFLRANAVVNFHTNQGESRATVALVIRKALLVAGQLGKALGVGVLHRHLN